MEGNLIDFVAKTVFPKFKIIGGWWNRFIFEDNVSGMFYPLYKNGLARCLNFTI